MRLTPMQQRVHARCTRAKKQLAGVVLFSLLAVCVLVAAPGAGLTLPVAVVACLAAMTQADALAHTLRDIARHV